jgi:hypothetical protein
MRSKKAISSTKNKDTNLKQQTVIIGTCFINMGITWSFGFFLVLPFDEYTKTVFAFFFCFFNSLQGFLIFTIYVLLSKSRRKYATYVAKEKFRQLKKVLYENNDLATKEKDHFESRSFESEMNSKDRF